MTESQSSKSDFSPKGILLEYPFLIDLSLQNFIDDFQDFFVKKSKSNNFVLSKKFSKKALRTLFFDYISENIERIVSEISRTHSSWKNVYVIVSETGRERSPSFEMVEKDILLDLEKIITVCEDVFSENFEKQLSNNDLKTIWCRHNFLLAHDWEAICSKKVFGKNNFVAPFSGETKKVVEEKTEDLAIEKTSRKERSLIVAEAAQLFCHRFHIC